MKVGRAAASSRDVERRDAMMARSDAGIVQTKAGGSLIEGWKFAVGRRTNNSLVRGREVKTTDTKVRYHHFHDEANERERAASRGPHVINASSWE